MRLALAAALVTVAVALPAAPASAVFCYPLPTGHCIAPCDVPSLVWDTTGVEGPRCVN